MAEIIEHSSQQQSPRPSFGAKVIRVLIIDDHVLVRAGIRILLESQDGMSVVGEASNAEEALPIALSTRPAIILLDMDVASDLELLPEFSRITPEARVIVVTSMSDSDTHRHAVRLGAIGLVRKKQPIEVLLQAIAAVHAGKVWLDQTLVADVFGEITRGGTCPTE